MFHINKKKTVVYGFIVIILIIFVHPGRFAQRNYEYIKRDDIMRALNKDPSSNLSYNINSDCEYRDILQDESSLSPSIVDGDLSEGYRIKEGGEYAPPDCKPLFSSAIIVPYRDRAEQLRGFLVFMHTILRRQRIHYRIFVVEQVDTKPFNRAKLMNIGAKAAMRAGFTCLILHDVDLLPLRLANLYACTECPRHMSCIINKFRFVLPYLTLFGGTIAIVASQFKAVNGMSNEYFGWGGEDDDLSKRLEAHNFKLCRFEPELSRYHMIPHEDQPKSVQRNELLRAAKDRMASDGLNSLQYTEVATVLHPLFTHIMVDL